MSRWCGNRRLSAHPLQAFVPAARSPLASARLAAYAGLMDTHRAQFDSHRFVKRLTTAGLSEEVAEILADEHTNLTVPDDVATKGDVAAVETSLAAVQADLATVKAVMVTKEELAAFEQRLLDAILETRIGMIKWMITTMMVFSGIVIGAMTALQ